MTYVQVDDQFPEHPKAMELGLAEKGLWLEGLCYASRNLTDGFIPAGFVRRLGPDATAAVDSLVLAKLWQPLDGGYQIHDYPDWQRTREDIKALAEKRAEAGRAGGFAKARNRMGADDSSKPLANASWQTASKASKPYPDTDTDTDTDTAAENTNTAAAGGNAAATAAGRAPYSTDFEKIWREYPKGHGSKAATYKHWQRLKPSPIQRDEIAAGLAAWKDCGRWKRGFILDAENWFRDRRWEDDPPEGDPPDARASPNGLSRSGDMSSAELFAWSEQMKARGQ